jgi:uncharacterized protein (TIGR03083 family)
LRDLVTHVASIHARTAFVCTALPQAGGSPIEPPDGLDPCDWFAQTLPSMLEALRILDPEAEGWTLFPDRRVSTWERRMVIETGIHRWDAQSASEAPEPLLPIVARHGLDEFSDLWLPRLGDVPTLCVEATDLGQTWTYGTRRSEATVQGTASDLYLRLMARPGVSLPEAWATAVDQMPTPTGAA